MPNHPVNSGGAPLRDRLLGRTAFSGLPLAGLGLALLPGGAMALPQDGVISAGAATIAQTGASSMTINQASMAAVIDWQSFDIGASETVEVFQPSALATLLNRVVGGGASNILGQLSATGRLTLINPAGITIGHGARIDVSGLIASTANIGNTDFMAGNHTYSVPGLPGARISNAGEITARGGGLVALVGPSVANSGVISARLGKIAIAGGAERFTLDLYGDDLIHIGVDDALMGAIAADALVANSGAITADGGVIQITARAGAAAVESVINMGGVVQARSVGMENGEVVFYGGDAGIVQVSGTVDVSGKAAGETGGSIKVLGDKVALLGDARLDASGDAGGGGILVGGAFQGKGDTPTASRTFVGRQTHIVTDAITTGDAGAAIVWADIDTRYYGNISARGGALSGDGGMVEVSGRQRLGFDGKVNTSAPNGRGGSLLLDPDFIVIANGGGAADDGQLDVGSGGAVEILFGDGGAVTFTISENALEALTDSLLILQANKQITLNDLADNVLDLRGISEGIEFKTGNPIDSDGGAGFTMATGDTISFDVGFSITANGGSITLGALSGSGGPGAGVSLAGQSITFNGVSTSPFLSAQATNGITVNADLTTTNTLGGGAQSGLFLDGDSAIDGFSGGITFAGGVKLFSGNTIELRADDGATSSTVGASDIWALGALTLIADADGAVTPAIYLADTVHAAGNLTINSDAGMDGNGAFGLIAGNSLLIGGDLNFITAADFDILGFIDAGAKTVQLNHSTPDSFAVGGLDSPDVISAAEISRITAGQLSIVNGAEIIVNDISAAQSTNIGFFVVQTSNEADIFFFGPASFRGFSAYAEGNIFIDADLETTQNNMILNADFDADASGMLTIGGEGSPIVSAAAGAINITASDVDLNAFSVINAATAVSFTQSSGQNIILGNGVAFSILLTNDELQRITAAATSFHTAGNILVDGVSGVAGLGTVSLYAGGLIFFQNAASTFATLAAYAGGLIQIDQNLTTSLGDLFLDADQFDDKAGLILIGSGLTLTAASSLHLLADEGGAGDIFANGNLSLLANDGVFLEDDLDILGQLTVNADTGFDGAGGFSITSGQTLTTNGFSSFITAADADLAGSINAGLGTVQFTHSGAGANIGLGGGVTQPMQFDLIELQNITAGDTIFFRPGPGDIIVDGVSGVSGLGSAFLQSGGQITFQGGPSAFNDLTAFADGGISINADLSSTIGGLVFDADLSNDGGSLLIAGNVVLNSSGIMILGSNELISSGDMASLLAKNGVHINDNFEAAGTLTINTDTDGDGTGTILIADSVTLAATGSLIVTAADYDIQGFIAAGTGTVVFTNSTPGDFTVGGVGEAGGAVLDAFELGRITAGVLSLNTLGDFLVDTVGAADSGAIANLQLFGGGSLDFFGTDSTFRALEVSVENGIFIFSPLTTTTGDLSLESDFTDGPNGGTLFISGPGLITSGGALILRANLNSSGEDGGDISSDVAVSLIANNGVFIYDNFNANSMVTIDTDADGNGGAASLLGIFNGATLITNGNALSIRANGILLSGMFDGGEGILTGDGYIDTGGGALSFTNATGGQIILGGAGDLDSLAGFGISASGLVINGAIDDYFFSTTGTGTVTISTTPTSVDDEAWDTEINLFFDDGLLDLADFIANDDDGHPTSGPHSSQISLVLNAGDYLLRVGNFNFGAPDGSDPVIIAAVSTGGEGKESDYNLLITGAFIVGGGTGSTAHFSNAELLRITAGSSDFVTAGDITVNGVSGVAVLGAVALSGNQITFQGGPSSFDSLIANAENGIIVNADLETDGEFGFMELDGDFSDDSLGGIVFAGGVTLTSANSIRLDADSFSSSLAFGISDIFAAGELTLNAGQGVFLIDTLRMGGLLSVNADTDFDGGSLFIASDQAVITNGFDAFIKASFFSINGAVNAGANLVDLTETTASGFCIGGTGCDENDITADDLSRITAGQLNINSGGTIFVDEISGAQSAGIALLQLFADNQVNLVDPVQIHFTGATSFRALEASARDDIIAGAGITVTEGDLVLNADVDMDDTGDLFIGDGATLVSTGGGILIIAADIDMGLTGAINAAGRSVEFNQSIGESIGLGATPGFMHLSTPELSRITAQDTFVRTNGNIFADGLGGVSGLGYLQLDGNQIFFQGGASTLNRLLANAEHGLTINANITTAIGDMLLDSDESDDSNSDLTIASGITLASAGIISVDGDSNGTGGAGIFTAGAVSLLADNGVFIRDDFFANGLVTINADTGGDGGGGFGVFNGSTLSTSGFDLSITTNSIDLASGSVLFSDNFNTGASAAWGNQRGNWIASGGVYGAATETFLSYSSVTTFPSLTDFTVELDINQVNNGGVWLRSSISESGVTGLLLHTGNAFSTSLQGFYTHEVVNDGVAPLQNLVVVPGLQGSNAHLRIKVAGNDYSVFLNDGLTPVMTFSTGAFASGAVGLYDTHSPNPLQTYDNVVISINGITGEGNGFIDAGSGTVTFTSSLGGDIGLGNAETGVSFAADDLARITASAINFNTTGGIVVDGFISADEQATRLSGNTITFEGDDSVFFALDARADQGVVVNANLTTTNGDLIMDGDFSDDFGGGIAFAGGIILTAAGQIFLGADSFSNGMSFGASDIWAAGALTLISDNNNITIDDVLRVNGALTLQGALNAAFFDQVLVNGPLSVDADEFITFNTTLDVTGAADFNAGGGVRFFGVSNIGDALTVETPGDVLFGGALSVGGPLSANAGLNISFDGITNVMGATILRAGNFISFGGPSAFGSLNAEANRGFFVSSNVTASDIFINADADEDDDGDLVVADGVSLSATAGNLDIIAADADLGADSELSATGLVKFTQSTGQNIGLGSGAGALQLSNPELQRIFAPVSFFSTFGAGNVIVDSVSGVGGLGEVNLETQNQIFFQGAASTFLALDARAQQGIAVNANLNATGGGIYLDGDRIDEAGGGISFAGGVILTAAGPINLFADASSFGESFGASDIWAAGELTLIAADGASPSIVLGDTLRMNGTLTVNADSDADGNGMFRLAAGHTLFTGGFDAFITAADVDIAGSINAGAGLLRFTQSAGSSIGLGGNSGGEGEITGSGLLIDGDIDDYFFSTLASGLVTISVTETEVDGGDFDTEINLFFDDGVLDLADFIDNDDDGGAGLESLIIQTLDAGSYLLRIGNFNFGNSSGTDPVIIADTNSGASGISGYTLSITGDFVVGGGGGASMQLSAAELNRITAARTEFTTGGDIIIDSAGDVSSLGGALLSGNAITFQGGASTFFSLDALAQHGITVNADLSTTGGGIFLDGDTSDAASGGITFASGVTLTAAGPIKLFADASSFGDEFGGSDIWAAGELTLIAADGASPSIVLGDTLRMNGTLTLNADSDADGNGVFQLAAGQTLFTGGFDAFITAADVDIAGNINAGTGLLQFTQSKDQAISLGGEGGGAMHFSLAELGRIMAGGAGFATGGQIFVNAVTGVVGLGEVSLASGNQIFFQGGASSFAALNAGAEDGIFVNFNLSVTGNSLTLDGDTSDEAGGGISFAAGVTLSAFQDIELLADQSGTSTVSGARDIWALGALTLTTTQGDVHFHDVLRAAGPVVITAGDTVEFFQDALLGGSLKINANDNEDDAVNFHANASIAGNADITGASDVIFSGVLEAGGLLTIGSGGFVQFANDAHVTGAVVINAVTGIDILEDFSANSLLAAASGAGGRIRVFDDHLGGVTPFQFVELTADFIELHDVTTNKGRQTYGNNLKSGTVIFNSTYTTNGGAFNINGSVLANSPTTIATGGGGINISGSVGGARATFNSGGGAIKIAGPVNPAGIFNSGGGPILVNGVDLGGPSAAVTQDILVTTTQLDALERNDAFAGDQQKLEKKKSAEDRESVNSNEGEGEGGDDAAADDPYLRVVDEEDLGETNDVQDDEGTAAGCACGA